MSNLAEATSELGNFIHAGVPLVMIHSAERPRVEGMVRRIASAEGISVFYYTEARQVRNLTSSAPSKDVGSDPIPFANSLFLKSRHTVFVLGDTRRLDQDSLYTRELLSTVHLARETGNTLVTVSTERVWPRISRFGLQITLDFPDFDERTALIRDFRGANAGRVGWDVGDVQQLATLTRGLSEMQVQNLLRSALVAKGHLDASDFYDLAARKERLFSPVPNVVAVRNSQYLQVAGLENLKEWLDRKRTVFFAPDERLAEFSLSAPKGVLLAGVPGCGKSYSARMVASRWGLPLFRFDLGSVYDKYVGESERRMQEALDYIDDVAPCVLWVDEIEKALATSSSESDVGRRVLGQFLFWLQESRARVFLVATANDVRRLPPELFRKGRFSETFFVDLPNRRERREALALYARQSLHLDLDGEELERLSLESQGFSYSDIEQSVKDLAERVMAGEVPEPTADDIARHLAHTIPITRTRNLDDIRAWGRDHAQPASKGVYDG